ncbi:DUF567 domain protein [Purpureocillium lilacinum]|uniref:DUF567 domain protein n=1 Tax=Purpureocillium lilacinum TaxID=33203 RepID=A0A2U3EHD9_PURLI|nr:DUF567 domain protein [Purpureocillium lilacinum]
MSTAPPESEPAPNHTTAQSAPVQRQIGIFDQFISQNMETVVLKEQVASPRFNITLANGQPILKLENWNKKCCTWRRAVTDMQNNHLLDIVREGSFFTRYVFYDPQGRKIGQVAEVSGLCRSHVEAKLQSRNGHEDSFAITGRRWGAEIICHRTGAVVAHRIDGPGGPCGRMRFKIIIPPGFDMALMVALGIATTLLGTG